MPPDFDMNQSQGNISNQKSSKKSSKYSRRSKAQIGAIKPLNKAESDWTSVVTKYTPPDESSNALSAGVTPVRSEYSSLQGTVKSLNQSKIDGSGNPTPIASPKVH